MIGREVDPNEAPEGFYAEPSTWGGTCKGCAFDAGGCFWKKCPYADCTPSARKDKCYVIFKKKEA